MANKQSFTPQEWTKILESTMLAGMAVTAAEPSGLWGLMKEGFASSSALAQAKADASSNELIKAVVAEYETSEGRAAVQEALRKRFAGAKPGDAVQRSLDNLREVSAILAAKKCERPLGSACGRKNFSVLDCDRAKVLGAECLRSVLQGLRRQA